MRLRLAAAILTASMVWTFGMPVREPIARAQSTPASAPAVPANSARAYFDHARKLGFPAAGQTTPYVLRATFTTRASSGVVETGTYTDTWLSDKKWRREAVLSKSRFIRCRDGKKLYRLDEGPDAAVLQFVLT